VHERGQPQQLRSLGQPGRPQPRGVQPRQSRTAVQGGDQRIGDVPAAGISPAADQRVPREPGRGQQPGVVAAEKIAAELAAIASSGMVLPGSITQRRTRRGRRNCGCHADPPRLHGPYWQWTRKIAAKTICRWLSDDQHHDYQAWIDNDRRLRELLARLETLGTAALEADPRWER
jgi:hypothetical protein